MQHAIRVAAIFCLLASPAFAQSTTPNSYVAGVVINRATVNSSTTITTGNTFQTVLASNLGTSTQRQALTIQNNNTTDSCWLFLGPLASATKATSILLASGQAYTRYFPFVPSDAVNVTCATTSDTIYLDTQ